MTYRKVLPTLVLALASSTLFLAAQENGSPAKVPDFPVVLQQSVTAGKTPVGTKIQAKLSIATLVDGTVVPRNATFTGEVVESVAKTATGPSRLAIRVDSAKWKNGSAGIGVRAYFTGSYYPTTIDEPRQDLQYGAQQPVKPSWNGQGQYPDPNSPAYKPFPGNDSDKGSSVPDAPLSKTAKNSVLMKGVDAGRGSDGTIVLTSKRSNIKLERYTTYVVSSGEMIPQR